MHTLLHSVSPTLQQSTADPPLHQRLLDTHRQVWVSLLWGHCSFLLGPGEHKALFVPFQNLFPQSCVSKFWWLYGGLMVTSSKRAGPLPLWQSTADPYLLRRHPNTVLSQSLWGLWVLAHIRYVWALWASLAGMGFGSKCDFPYPIILLGLLLCPWMWISPQSHSRTTPATTPAPTILLGLLCKSLIQSYGCSGSHVWMWEKDYKESWTPKNWCFWTVVLEKTLESPFKCKEIQQVHPKGNQSWIFIGRTDIEVETPTLWPPDVKNWFIWKDPDAGKD